MPDMLNIKETARRGTAEGMPISEYSLRRLVKTGALPARYIGRKILIYYPSFVAFMQCADGGDNQPATVAERPGIRRLEVRP